MLIHLTASQAATVRAALQCFEGSRRRESFIDVVTDEGRCAALPVEEYGAVLTPLSQAEALHKLSREARRRGEEVDALQQEAVAMYAIGSDDDIEIDDEPLLSAADDGTWVSAWVWVSGKEEVE